MIFDTDDVWEGHDRLDLLVELKLANPLFRMTAFAVPCLGSDAYWDSLPDFIELAAHGWLHPDAHEAEHWSYEDAMNVLLCTPLKFAEVWKSPGWLISEGTYQACLELDWAVADQMYNDHRRPFGLRYHCEGEFDHVHTHVMDWGSNGLNESWDYILDRVTNATSFELVSEVVRPWLGAGVTA